MVSEMMARARQMLEQFFSWTRLPMFYFMLSLNCFYFIFLLSSFVKFFISCPYQNKLRFEYPIIDAQHSSNYFCSLAA